MRARPWVAKLVRLGYGAKGLLYCLIGVVLGTLEERLNQGFRVDVPEVPVSSNGHGDIELVAGASA